jgi:hypothetical protein
MQIGKSVTLSLGNNQLQYKKLKYTYDKVKLLNLNGRAFDRYCELAHLVGEPIPLFACAVLTFVSPMVTSELLYQVAHADGEARSQAFATLAQATGNPAAYAVVVATLVGTTDNTIAFFCLDALIKQFPALLPAEAPRLVPVLLSRLIGPDHPVTDRAIWALSVTGPATVPALCQAIEQAPSTAHRVAYAVALGKNTHVHTQAAPVLSLFARLFKDAEAPVRYWAMVALMDMSPLRMWFDARLNAQDFDLLYPGIMRVAEEFVQNDQDDFAGRYRDLIARYWQNKEKDRQ